MPVFVPALVEAIADILLNPEPLSDGTLPPWVDRPEKSNNTIPPDPPANAPDRPRNGSTFYGGPTTIYKKEYQVYRPSIRIELRPSPYSVPPGRLPKEADGQTSTPTPVGQSIDLSAPLPDRTFGKMLAVPISSKELEFPKLSDSATRRFSEQMAQKKEQGVQRYAKFLALQQDGVEPDDKLVYSDISTTIMPDRLRGFNSTIGLVYGLEPLLILSDWFLVRSQLGKFPVRSTIPKKYRLKEWTPETTPKFKTSSSDFLFQSQLRLERLYQLLGGNKWWEPEKILTDELIGGKPKEEEPDPRLGEDGKLIEIKNWKALIDWIYGKLYGGIGLDQFPVEVPETLLAINDDEDPKELTSLTEFFAWFVEQIDGLVGEFPIEIEYKDVDPLTQGDQTELIRLPNIAETMGDMYALAKETATLANIIEVFLLRLSSEVISTKNLAVITQDYVRANASYLGYRGNPKTREIEYSIDLTEVEKVEDVLRNTVKKVQGWACEQPESVQEYLEKLMFAASLIKETNFIPADRADLLKDAINGMVEGDASTWEEAWKNFKEAITDKNSVYNKGYPEVPTVEEWESNSSQPN